MAHLHLHPQHANTGSMTRAMRVPWVQSDRRVLRVAFIVEGRVIDERMLKSQVDVTVGSHERAMFVLSGPDAPQCQTVFEHRDGKVLLRLSAGMRGRIATSDGTLDLQQWVQLHRAPAQDLVLPTDSRGQVRVGGATILFQFVPLPKMGPRPQLPASIQAGLAAQIDWRFTIIAALSFLAHFGAVGMLYSDWVDTKIEDGVTVAGLIDTIKSFPAVAPPAEAADPSAETSAAPGQSSTDQGSKHAARGSSHGAGSNPAGDRGMSGRDRASLSSELDRINVATLAALGTDRPATSNVITTGELPTQGLEQAAASAAGVRDPLGSGLNIMTSRDGRRIPGASDRTLASIGSDHPIEQERAGVQTTVKPPPSNASVAATSVATGAPINNLSKTVGSIRGRFRACYQRGLDGNPEMQGGVRVTAMIGPNGEVQRVETATSGTISQTVASCVASAVRSAHFEAPQGDQHTVVVIPVIFKTQ